MKKEDLLYDYVCDNDRQNDICGICRESYNGEMYRGECGHEYHFDCILEYAISTRFETYCPLCRDKLSAGFIIDFIIDLNKIIN